MSKVAVVTGAGGGMGRATVLKFAEAGYAVGLIDLDEAALSATTEAVGQRVHVHAEVADISDLASLRRSFEGVVSNLGTPWVVAAVAGILRGGLVLESSTELLDKVLAVNFLGSYHTALIAGELMAQAGNGGRIVLWSSISAQRGTPGYAAYAASKAAVDSLTMTLAAEWAEYGITVNAISPGSIDTPMLRYLEPEYRAASESAIPKGRWGKPEDVAAAALFLAGEDADWITGVNLAVDGGESAAKSADLGAVRARLAAEAEGQHSQRSRSEA